MFDFDNTQFMIGLLFFLGACLGSFGNVVIYRLPLGESVVTPRSRCPKCKKQIAWYDNVPIFSWLLFLRGKCRNCKNPISWRYPLVELIMGSLFAYTFYRFGYQWITVEYLIFIFALVISSFIDIDHMILPDVFTLSGIVIGLSGALLNPERNFLNSLFGVLLGGGVLWALAYLYFLLRKEDGIGGGDIKLLAWVGAVLGWKSVPFVIMSGSILGSIIGVTLMLVQRKTLKTAIPFGPYLALGAVIYMFAGDSLGLWYLQLLFPL